MASDEQREASTAPVSPCEIANQKASEKSDLSRAFSEDGALKTHVGGQALIEGIMMRGKYNWAVAVREPDGGIYLEDHEFGTTAKKPWAQWPIVRGVVAFVHSLTLGFKALEIAAMHAFDDEEEAGYEKTQGDQVAAVADEACAVEVLEELTAEDGQDEVFSADASCSSDAQQKKPFSWKDDFGRPDTMIDALGAQRTLEVVTEEEPVEFEADASKDNKPEKESEGGLGHTEMVISMVMGLVLGVVLFIVVPAALTNLIVGEYDDHTLAWNIVDGILRVVVFVFYLWLIGRMKDIQRMFGYHGAEHKTIHCYEHGLPLTPENARSFPCLHVRCGTAFLIMVMLIAIFVYTVIPLNPLIAAWGVPDGPIKLLLVMFVRILFMPVIAGVSYEITVKWAGSHPDNPLVKVVLWPGMQMQYLTTREPDDGMIECAIAAMKCVLEREEREARRLAEAAEA